MVLMVMACFSIFFLNCKLEIVGAAEVDVQEEPVSTLELKGRVVNKETLNGISNATVIINGSYEIFTNSEGYYEFPVRLVAGEMYEIWAYADKYGYGSTSAQIDRDNGATIVNTIALLPLNPPVVIGSDGGTIEEKTSEVLTGDSSVSVSIPTGALDEDTAISVTPFEGVDVPGLPPFGNLNIATVHIAPIGMSLNKKMMVTFPLPLTAKYLGDSIPLLCFDKNTFRWLQTEIVASVDTVNNVATAEISKLNTYSLAIQGSYEETIEDSTIIDEGRWKMQSFPIDESWQATVEYPEGIPNQSSFSPNWLKNAVSQNTQLISGRVNFFDQTTTVLNGPGYCYIRITVIIIIIKEYVIIITSEGTTIRILNKIGKRRYRVQSQNCTGAYSVP